MATLTSSSARPTTATAGPPRAAPSSTSALRAVLAQRARWTVEGNQAGARFGASVATAGDVNGDGYADVIVGAPCYDNGECGRGPRLRLPRVAPPASLLLRLDGRERPGTALASALVGRIGRRRQRRRLCGVMAVGAIPVQRRPARRARSSSTTARRLGLAPRPPTGPPRATQDDAGFGYSVGTAGDVNGDGYADVIVGVPILPHGLADEGRAQRLPRIWIRLGLCARHGLSTAIRSDGEVRQCG